jgi:hypothetical protein
MIQIGLSNYINSAAKVGLKVEHIIDETDRDSMERDGEFSSQYYSPCKVKKLPLSFIIKARKGFLDE